MHSNSRGVLAGELPENGIRPSALAAETSKRFFQQKPHPALERNPSKKPRNSITKNETKRRRRKTRRCFHAGFRRPPAQALTPAARPPPCLLRPHTAAPLPRRLQISRHHFPATHRSCRETEEDEKEEDERSR